MREGGRGLASEHPREPDLGPCRVQEILAPDDEVDTLAQVVDDDAEPIRPVAVPVPHREVAVRSDPRLRRPDDAIRPRLPSISQGDSEHRPVDSALTAIARAAAKRSRTSCAW